MLKRVVTSPPFYTNTYILHIDDDTFVVDPGTGIGQHVEGEVSVVLTHAHYDHIAGIRELKVKHLFVSPEDADMLKDPRMNLSDLMNDPFVYNGEILNIDERFQTVPAPGHTPGSRIIIVGNRIFTGDTVFCSSIGRTDLPGGDERLMSRTLKRIHRFFSSLPPDVPVFPGHMEPCTVKHLLNFNPFLRET